MFRERYKSTMKHWFSFSEELACFHVNALILKTKKVWGQGTGTRWTCEAGSPAFPLQQALDRRWAAIFTAGSAGRRLGTSRMVLCWHGSDSHPIHCPQTQSRKHWSVEQTVRVVKAMSRLLSPRWDAVLVQWKLLISDNWLKGSNGVFRFPK